MLHIINNTRLNYCIAAAAVLLMVGCESNFKEVQKINFSEFMPSGEAENFNLKYTDSGRIKSILVSPKMLDYSNVEFPFTEFPKGINVTMYDSKGKRTFITSEIVSILGFTRSYDESIFVAGRPSYRLDCSERGPTPVFY
jgi:hypothetical protein